MHLNSNEVSFQNQLAMGGVTHKLYIHAQTLQFYQCGTNFTFTTPTRPHICELLTRPYTGIQFF